MPLKNIVFVLGAGSNCNYGFYTNKSLMNYCANEFTKKYKPRVPNLPKIDGSKFEISYSDMASLEHIINLNLHNSIDHLLSLNPNLETIGKIAISDAILNAERKAIHFSKQSLYKTFFRYFCDTILQPSDIEILSENEATFITFNYDRSLEYFFYTALQNYISKDLLSYDLINDLDQIFPIYHFYGSLGSIFKTDKDFLGYGSNPPQANLIEASNNIDVLYGLKAPKYIDEIQKTLSEANAIFFLGFGFDSDNLKKLMPDNLKPSCKIYGTGYGLDNELISRMNKRFKNHRCADNHSNILKMNAEEFAEKIIHQYIRTKNIMINEKWIKTTTLV